MEIYVAGKTDDWERVRRIQEMCTRYGHGITYDWTKDVEEGGAALPQSGVTNERRCELAMNDWSGVQQADLLIAVVDHPGLCGTLIEIGIAIGCGLDEIIIVGEPERNSVFFALGQVRQVDNEFHLADVLPVNA